jgi:hypothetical protein
MFSAPGTAKWVRVAPDSLRLTFSNGFTGVVMELGWHGVELRGTGTIYYDFIRPGPKPQVRILARREACSSRASSHA